MTKQEKLAREKLRDAYVMYKSQPKKSVYLEYLHDYCVLCYFVKNVFPNIDIDKCEDVWRAKLKKGEL